MDFKIVALSAALAAAAPLTLGPSAHATNGERLNVKITDVTTAESIQTADNRTVFSLDQLVVVSGRGVLDDLTGRCLALEEVENETGASVTAGYCTYVDSDGDNIFEEFEMARDSLEDEATGAAVITGGTGKYEGISGQLTHTRRLLLPGPVEGVFPGIGRITGTVSLGG